MDILAIGTLFAAALEGAPAAAQSVPPWVHLLGSGALGAALVKVVEKLGSIVEARIKAKVDQDRDVLAAKAADAQTTSTNDLEKLKIERAREADERAERDKILSLMMDRFDRLAAAIEASNEVHRETLDRLAHAEPFLCPRQRLNGGRGLISVGSDDESCVNAAGTEST